MGHFDRPSIQLSTLALVYPALMITYLGQVCPLQIFLSCLLTEPTMLSGQGNQRYLHMRRAWPEVSLLNVCHSLFFRNVHQSLQGKMT